MSWVGQNRVNFHWNPGRGTAGGWGLTPPGQTEPGIPYHVTVTLGSGGGDGAAGTLSRLGIVRRRCGPRERVCFCRVFSLSVSLLLLFPLFAALLNCPYPDPPVSASFFPFSFSHRWGEGRPRGALVAGCSRNQNNKLCRYMICLFFDAVVAFQSYELAAWYIPAKQKVFSVLRSLTTGVIWSKSRFSEANAYFQ